MKQPLLAPAAVGGSMLAGVTAMLIGGYRIVDCFRFETGRGACDEAIDSNTPSVIAGAAALAGSWGGLFTYNRKLERPNGHAMVQAVPPWRRPEDCTEPAPVRMEPLPEPPIVAAADPLVEELLKDSFKAAIAAGEVSRIADAPAPESAEPELTVAERMDRAAKRLKRSAP